MNIPQLDGLFPYALVRPTQLRFLSKLLAALTASCLLSACGDGDVTLRSNQRNATAPLEATLNNRPARIVKDPPSNVGLPTGRLSLNDPEYQRFFGPGLEAAFTSLTSFSGIGNIGGTEYRISQRLRVPPGISGTIKSIRYYSPSGVGYASGNGGTMRFQVLPDNGTAAHMPLFSAAPRAQGDFSPQSAGMVGGAYPINTAQFQTVLLNAVAKVPIASGELIHVYTREMVLNPSAWSGVNVRAQTESQKSPNRWLNFADAGVQIFFGAPGFAAPGNTIETTLAALSPSLPDGGYRTYPIIAIELDNGQLFGTSDMETYSYGTSDITLAPGGKLVERFNLTRSRVVDYLSLRFAAKTNGTLAWRIRGINGGAIVTSGTINVSANFSQIDTFGTGFLTDALSWVDIPLSPTVLPAAGVQFDVELEALSGTFAFAGTVNGSEYGYSSPAAYTESSGYRWDGSAYVKLFPSPIGSTAACCNLDVMFRTAKTLAPANDFNGDGKSDIIWRNTNTGVTDVWLMEGLTVGSAQALYSATPLQWVIKGTGDFNGDGTSDILWQHITTGQVVIWTINGSTISTTGSPGTRTSDWAIQSVGDFNGDGKSDILWRNTNTGVTDVWLMEGLTVGSAQALYSATPLQWVIKGIGDFNGDGTSDILWQHITTGQVVIWTINGSTISTTGSPGTRTSDWAIQSVGDFNGDGKSDILWRNTNTGVTDVWLMEGLTVGSAQALYSATPLQWVIKGTGDFNGDGTSDILWQHITTGQVVIWTINGSTISTTGSPGTRTSDWAIQPRTVDSVLTTTPSKDDFNGDGKSDILWRNTNTGVTDVWLMEGLTVSSAQALYSATPLQWVIKGTGDFNGDGTSDILWQHITTGQVVIWTINGSTISTTGSPGTRTSDWAIQSVGDFNGDGKSDILWRNTNTGVTDVWLMEGLTVGSAQALYSATPLQWVIKGIGDFNGDGTSDILWQHITTGQVVIWTINGSTISTTGSPGTRTSDWAIQSVGDFNGDGKSDILWRNTNTGVTDVWLMEGLTVGSAQALYSATPLQWVIKGIGDFNGDGTSDILWQHITTGQVVIWTINGSTISTTGSPGTRTSDWAIQ